MLDRRVRGEILVPLFPLFILFSFFAAISYSRKRKDECVCPRKQQQDAPVMQCPEQISFFNFAARACIYAAFVLLLNLGAYILCVCPACVQIFLVTKLDALGASYRALFYTYLLAKASRHLSFFPSGFCLVLLANSLSGYYSTNGSPGRACCWCVLLRVRVCYSVSKTEFFWWR